MSSDYKLWRDVEERFKFFLMLAALCACGYLVWHRFIYIVLVLIFGGVSTAMVPLYNVSQQKLREIEQLDESELKNAIATLRNAEKIISDYHHKNPKITNQLLSLKDTVKHSKTVAQRREEKQRERKIEREKVITEKRIEKGFSSGVPPNDYTNECPLGFPIRVTENLKGERYRKEKFRGIFYEPGDSEYKSVASWCFESINDAKANGFRRSHRRRSRN